MIQNGNEKKASQCADMSEIRTEIDCIDRQVISLLGERYGFVSAASQFQKSSVQVKDRPLFDFMLKERIALAEKQGLSSDLIEKIRSDLVSLFISEEMKHWEKPKPDLT